MNMMKGFRLMMAGLALLATAAMPAACAAGPEAHDAAPWEDAIRAMDQALERGDIAAAARARQEAYLAALSSRRWEAMAAVGDASLRLARLPAANRLMLAEARRSYVNAFFRARHQGSLDGVLRVTEAFAALGDREVARQGLVIANVLAAASREPYARERVRALQERLAAELPLMGGGALSDPLPPRANAAVLP